MSSAQHSMTLTASPPRAVSLYLTFQPAASRPVALTRCLDNTAPAVYASGEFLGRTGAAQVPERPSWTHPWVPRGPALGGGSKRHTVNSGLAHPSNSSMIVRDEEVVGSNPATPTVCMQVSGHFPISENGHWRALARAMPAELSCAVRRIG